MQDRFIRASAAGLAGGLVMGFLTTLLNFFPGINVKLPLGPSVMFVPNSLQGTYEGNFIGSIATLICSTLLGIFFLLVFEKTGYSHPMLKGAILGLITWFLLCGFINHGLSLGMKDNIVDNFVTITAHIAFGITAAWVLNRYRPKQLA